MRGAAMRTLHASAGQYVAFLRGINVGGNKLIQMTELTQAFESSGFEDVKTVLVSGNVLFRTSQADARALTRQIGETLERTLGFEIGVLLRTREEILSLVNADPFKNSKVTPDTRLYVTFVSEETQSELKIPYESPQKDFRIVSVVGRDICSVVELSPNRGTPDLMRFIEKEFGQSVTTRTWNTITRIGKLL
jgi:uncharacterized protein (DUF1697 family)